MNWHPEWPDVLECSEDGNEWAEVPLEPIAELEAEAQED